MKANLLVPLAAALGVTALSAQEQPPPDPPPPPAPPALASPSAAPVPERVIYLPHLPSVEELTHSAGVQGLMVVNLQQTSTEVTVTYRTRDNTTRTIAYRLLPTDAGTPESLESPVAAPAEPAPQVVQVVEVAPPPPTVIYRIYDPFRDDPFFADSHYFRRRAPVSIHLGVGWSSGPRYHGGHGWHHRRGHW